MPIELSRGRLISAKKVLIYGTEGIGKTTIASKFPRPIFLDTEGSTKSYDVARFYPGIVSTWQQVVDAVNYAKEYPEEVGTFVLDTADWMDRIISDKVCADHSVTGIEDISYGKGYTYIEETWKKLLLGLEVLTKNGTHVVILAHSQMRKFEQPDEMGAYDRYELKLSKKAAPLVKEWADMVLFANYKTYVVEDSKTKVKKGQGGKRVMYTSHHPCWDAKNRDGLPEELPFEYESIKALIEPAKEVKKEPTKPEKVDKPTKSKTPAIDARVAENEPEEFNLAYSELRELMVKAQITADEVKDACVSKGFQSSETEVWDYSEEFINQMLIAKWSGFSKFIRKNSTEVPFVQHWEDLNKEDKYDSRRD